MTTNENTPTLADADRIYRLAALDHELAALQAQDRARPSWLPRLSDEQAAAGRRALEVGTR